MKRTISVFLAALLACSIFLPVSGIDGADVAEPLPEMRVETANGYTLTISEQVMENGRIVRTYHNPKANLCQAEATSAMLTENKQEKAETILTALGMDEQYISDIPEDTLIESVDCEQIVATISHTKRDADGNVTYLTDAEMTQVAAALAQKPEDTYEYLYSDEYMTVTHVVYYYGGDLYKFTTNARWRTMPFWRSTDSIGSCAQDITIIPYSESGRVRYVSTTSYSDGRETRTETNTEEIINTQWTANGTWDGAVGIINLPNDCVTPETSVTHSDYRAYFEFEAKVREPGCERNFCTVGTYAHVLVLPILSPSVTIGPGKDVSFSIGISVAPKEERRSAAILLHYLPE